MLVDFTQLCEEPIDCIAIANEIDMQKFTKREPHSWDPRHTAPHGPRCDVWL